MSRSTSPVNERADVAREPSASPLTVEGQPESKDGAATWRSRSLAVLPRTGTLFGLLILIVVFSAARPSTFPTWHNTLTILNQGSLLAVVSGGLTICLVLGEFDLSIGYAVTLGGVVTALTMNDGVPPLLVVLIVIAVGLMVGLLNGLVVAYGEVNAFIATLGSGSVIYGIVLGLTGGAGVDITSKSLSSLGQGHIAGIPTPVVISVVVLLVLWLFLNKTELGRHIDAVGGNAAASRLSGIRVARVRLAGFLISGAAAAAVGLVLAAQLGAGYADSGDSYLLEAFTACFLGAVTLRDNEFNILGTAVGVLIISVTFNGLAQLGVSAFWQNVAQGAILIVAVLAPKLVRSLRRVRPARSVAVPAS